MDGWFNLSFPPSSQRNLFFTLTCLTSECCYCSSKYNIFIILTEQTVRVSHKKCPCYDDKLSDGETMGM